MFTGLIREIASSSIKGDRLSLKAKYRPSLGDSISINGACLSVVQVFDNGFEVELSHESRNIIALENYRGNVHIEPAMRLEDRVEGHILQGHIDITGVIKNIDNIGRNLDIIINIKEEFLKFIAPKGSIAIDGVSLTVNDVYKDSFRLTIIPITVEHSIIKEYRVGRRVNIETDMFARYIYHMIKRDKTLSWSEVDKIMAVY